MHFHSQSNYQIWYITICLYLLSTALADCPKRQILTSDTGIVRLAQHDYLLNGYCQWLIQGGKDKFVNLHFDYFLTECNYDYLYIYDGESLSSRLIGSFSGVTIPDDISAQSGSVLLHFYSDLNAKPPNGSFTLRYTITNCKHGCTPCDTNTRRCQCGTDRSGVGCDVVQCAGPQSCPNGGVCVRDASDGRRYCHCPSGYTGRFCNLDINAPVSSQGQWTEVMPSGVGFENRTGHSAVHDNDQAMWVYGGYNLYRVTNQLIRFNLSTSRWQLEFQSGTWPQPSYNHRAAEVGGCMYIAGGRNDTSPLSQFWRFCFGARTWTQLSDLPYALTDHTLTSVDKWLYVVGGLGPAQQEFLHSVLRYDTEAAAGAWEEVTARGGKTLDVKVAGHSTIYHPETESLIIFGGHKPNNARFSRHTNEIYIYHVEKRHWSRIRYPTSVDSVSPALAYHTASLMGNYMVVYGGQMQSAKTDPCTSNKIYVYHLICHRWVDVDEMYKSMGVQRPSKTPDSKGRHSHTAVVINDNILLILGGFRGNAVGDLWSYQVLSSITHNTNDSARGSRVCGSYSIHEGCVTDPECLWCRSPPYSGCTSRLNLPHCQQNAVHSCPGLCAALEDCQSCVVQSHNVTQPSYPGLHQLGQCAWCIHDSTCQPVTKLTGTCQLPPPEPIGWWLGAATTATKQSECTGEDNRPAGVRYGVYQHPVDPSLPDLVLSTANISFGWKKHSKGTVRSVAKFYLRPNNITGHEIGVRLRAKLIAVNVTMTHNSQESLVAQLTASSSTVVAQLGPSRPLLPSVSRGQRYLMQVVSVNDADPHALAAYDLEWNALAANSYTTIAKEFLEPYSDGICSLHRSCLSCQLDVGCGWCPATQQCVSRSNDSLTAAECGTGSPDQWLITDAAICDVCTDFIDCQECTAASQCEWSSSDLVCQRLGLEQPLAGIIVNSTLCPTRCSQRSNCTECLADRDECIWCESMQSCDQFSPYLVANSYGQCRAWKESHKIQDTCASCETYTNCTDCLAHRECGWCGSDFNPNVGVCTRGDYSTSANCSSVIHSALNVTEELLSLNLSFAIVNTKIVWELSTNATFSYGACPDVKECMLGLAECHENSTCENTVEAYECTCNQGFEGDGKIFCNKTCFYECDHGTCSGDPRYQCDCDLGWTNTTCDADCGCHNHSTCVNGMGTCDLCQQMTHGDHCELCLPTSYGNATIAPGCLPCDCNGHGRASMGLCDVETGVCHCGEGFEGDHCEKCSIRSTGDPRNGRLCYDYSHNRLVILNATGTHGVTSIGKYRPVSYSRWIITPFADLDTVRNMSDVALLTITIDSINTTCPHGYVYVYDGINTDDSMGYKVAFCGSVELNSVDIYSGYATIVYHGDSAAGEAAFIRYDVHQCNASCTGNRYCDKDEVCRCQTGYGYDNCATQLCPKNCSSHGYCNPNSHTCFCDAEYSGEDCSVASFLTVNRLIEGAVVGTSPTPRYGFTVVSCGTEGSILFGGVSTVDGMQNDLWRFDGKTWQLIVPTTPARPPGRYQHAAVCIVDDRMVTHMIIHGGLVKSSASQPITDREIWAFYFDNLTWVKKNVAAADLAGHTMVQVGQYSLLLTGGYSSTSDWSNLTYSYNFDRSIWTLLSQTTGAVPAGLMMHTALYHESSKSLYIHGGYRYYIDKMYPTNETFFFNTTSNRWYKRPDEYNSHTPSRYSHSAAQLQDRMLILGGLSSDGHVYERTISLYSYACDRWHNIGTLPTPLSAHSSLVNGSTVYIFSSTALSLSVDVITLPEDVCTLYSGSSAADCLTQRGCHACNDSGQYLCFDKRRSIPAPCVDINSSSQLLLTNDTCDQSVVTDRDCKSHKDCAQCLTTWPYHGPIKQKCKWCSFCNVGMCIETHQICSQENKCSRQQSEKPVVETCVEQRCRSATCEQCQTEAQDREGCIWTRQFMRSSEVGRQVSALPFENWNCVTKRLISLSTIQVWSAPPHICPAPCHAHSTCEACTSTDGGGSGGPAVCYWSLSRSMCLPTSALPLICESGICAPLIRSDSYSQCPLPCSQYTQCGHCQAQPHCGWCGAENSEGFGVCAEGFSSGPTNGSCSHNMTLTIVAGNDTNVTNGTTYKWHYMTCPLENECSNSHHTCDLEKERCIDLVLGHHCVCQDGYMLINNVCVPQCSEGCVNGECVRPDVCKCDFSWVGTNCSIPCQCNMHSDCAGPNATTTCTGCIDNTIGDQCQFCEKLSVGNATNGGVCESCFTVCNNHARICMDNATKRELSPLANQTLAEAYLSMVDYGPVSHKGVVCLNCANNTQGDKCTSCQDGFFRLSGNGPTAACQACKCQGHGSTCNPDHGADCDCKNNTLSSCVNKKNCHQQQCNRCQELYVGSPTAGNQCYLRLLTDKAYCLSREPKAHYPNNTKCSEFSLLYGQVITLAALPKFLNVDLKIYVNIEFGEVDVYIGKAEDFFVIEWDAVANEHLVKVGPKYTVVRDRKRRDLRSRSKRTASSNFTHTLHWVEMDSDKTVQSDYLFGTSPHKLYDSVYHIRGITRRTVITLPELHHDLRRDKFYVVLVSRSRPSASGSVLFRQDQIRIELFVFFAVFFSCFFKFLSICVIVWKIRGLYQQQQQRLARAVELGQMASRPFASVLLHFDESGSEPSSKNKKHDFQVNPASYEFTDDGVAVVGTVLFEMPGGGASPVKAIFGSALMTLRVLYPNRKAMTERHKDSQAAQKTTQT